MKESVYVSSVPNGLFQPRSELLGRNDVIDGNYL